MAYVYLVTHQETGRSYVGITTRQPGRRWKEHRAKSKRNPVLPFHRALAKYGFDAFSWRVIWDGPELRVKLIEQTLIRAGLGQFNCTAGGDGILGKIHTEETKQKMSTSAKARGQKPPPMVGTLAAQKVHAGAKRPSEWGAKISRTKREKQGLGHLTEEQFREHQRLRRNEWMLRRYYEKKAKEAA